MDIETFRIYCISKKGVTEEFPFDADTLVFKVMGKMFALVSLEKKHSYDLVVSGLTKKMKADLETLSSSSSSSSNFKSYEFRVTSYRFLGTCNQKQ